MIKERLTRPSTYIAMLAASASFMVAACGGGSTSKQERLSHTPQVMKGPAAGTAPFHGLLKCVVEPHKAWQPVPSDMNVTAIAQEMGKGVTPQEVSNGEWGPAHCQQAIEATQVGNAKAQVENQGGPCLVIGLDSAPVVGKTYHDVLAVCAALGMPQ
jgi:hypothetical protein